jgi:hypothetical protein
MRIDDGNEQWTFEGDTREGMEERRAFAAAHGETCGPVYYRDDRASVESIGGAMPRLWVHDLSAETVRVFWEACVMVDGETFRSVGVYEDVPRATCKADTSAVYDRVRARLDALLAGGAG